MTVEYNEKAKRIKLLRATLGLSMESFGSKLGVSKSAVCQWERGTKDVSERSVKFICQEYNVNPNWLCNGSGTMFLPNNEESVNEDMLSIKNCSEYEKRFLKSYLELEPYVREQLMDMFKTIFSVE